MKKKNWGFDVKDMDPKVRPQDDFFHYANGGWIKRSKLPSDEAHWGTFQILHTETQKKLKTIVDELLAKKRLPKGTPEQLVGDLYRSSMDIKLRNKLGASPLQPFREKIAALKNKGDLLRLIADFHVDGIGVLWGAAVDQDEKNSEIYIFHLYQDGLGMPEREYYLLQGPEQKRVRVAYAEHIMRMSKLLGIGSKEAKRRIEVIMGIETTLAKASMNKVDARDPHKTYHKMRLSELHTLAPAVDWPSYFKQISAGSPKYLQVMQPDFLKAVHKLVEEVPLEDWKVYFEWHLIISSAGLLSEKLLKANFAFYGTTLSGVKKMRPHWRRSLGAVNGAVGEALGRIYVKKHFTEGAKKKVDRLINDLFTAYKSRIQDLEWMSSATKKRALQKLKMIARKIGYPKRWRNYRALVIKADDYFGNMVRASRFEHMRNVRKLGKPVDREEWFMPPQMVNAYYNQGTNDIAFPAAILQPPFFNENADDAVNYGAIGSVIGHEITHGFDDRGSLYDGKGNLKSWWTKRDRARFEKRAKIIEKQFNEYEQYGMKVNGSFTKSENIADLGGASIAFDAYQTHLAKSRRMNFDGLTPEQRFFLGYALFERELVRPEAVKTQMLNDPHAPHINRINGPASNLPEFYEAFGVKKGDKLYRASKDRAKIW